MLLVFGCYIKHTIVVLTLAVGKHTILVTLDGCALILMHIGAQMVPWQVRNLLAVVGILMMMLLFVHPWGVTYISFNALGPW